MQKTTLSYTWVLLGLGAVLLLASCGKQPVAHRCWCETSCCVEAPDLLVCAAQECQCGVGGGTDCLCDDVVVTRCEADGVISAAQCQSCFCEVDPGGEACAAD